MAGVDFTDPHALRALEARLRDSLAGWLLCSAPACRLDFTGRPLLEALLQPSAQAPARRRLERLKDAEGAVAVLALAAPGCTSTIDSIDTLIRLDSPDTSCAGMPRRLAASYAGFAATCPSLVPTAVAVAGTCRAVRNALSDICATLSACGKDGKLVAMHRKLSTNVSSLEADVDVRIRASVHVFDDRHPSGAALTELILDLMHDWQGSLRPADVAQTLNVSGVVRATIHSDPLQAMLVRISPSPPPLPPPTSPPPSAPDPSPPPPTTPLPSPPPKAPLCGTITATPSCTGNTLELCYLDTRCKFQESDPYGGLGCNAGGVGVECRFCGFGDFANIPCPGDSSGLTGELTNGEGAAAALSQEENAEASPVLVSAAAAGVAIAVLACYMWRRWRRAKRSLREKAAEMVTASSNSHVYEMGVDKQGLDLDEKTMRDSFASSGKGDGGALGHPEASALGTVLSGSQAQLLGWNAMQFERMLDDGTLGKCYRVQLRADDASPDAGKKMVLRRLGVDVLNHVSKLEWAERVSEFQTLDEHPALLRTIGLASDGANNFGLLLESAPNSLDRILVRAEASEEIATKLRLGWPQLAREIAGGLEALHALDLAHLALHPGNVMLDSHTRVRLADYAMPIELIVQRRESVEKMNPPSELLEEHQLYSAPELLRAMVGLTDEEDESLAPADIWSLGCIILRLLTLERPYNDASLAANRDGAPVGLLSHTLPKIASGELHPAANLDEALHPWKPSEPAVPPKAATLIRRCTEADPANRPSALEAFELLSATVKRNARKMSAVPLPRPSERKQPGGVLHASLERDSVGEALGMESTSLAASVNASLERDSVGDALGLKATESVNASLERDSVGDALGLKATESVNASLERDSVGDALGLNATPANDTGDDDAAATFRGAGRAQPSRLQSRPRRGEVPKTPMQPAQALDEEEEEELKAGRAQPARLPTRKRGEQPAKALEGDEEEELKAGRAQPARLPTRKRGEQQPAKALEGDEEEQLKAGGRAQPARLQARKRGEQLKVWKQPSPEPQVDGLDEPETAREKVLPKRLPPRTKTAKRIQAAAQPALEAEDGQHGAKLLSDQQGGGSPRVRI